MNSENSGFQIPNLENLSLNSGQFQIPNLTLPSDFQAPNLSLTALATEHLGTGSNSLLDDIASLHLSNNSDSNSFQSPSLNGTETIELKAPELKPQTTQIDLSLALTPSLNPIKTKSVKKEDNQQVSAPRRPSIESEILISQDHWNKENFQIYLDSSNLGKVVCRRWRKRPLFNPRTRKENSDLKPFLFDVASPDDIVREAQSQAFTRPK